jgi:hypothetical protein
MFRMFSVPRGHGALAGPVALAAFAALVLAAAAGSARADCEWEDGVFVPQGASAGVRALAVFNDGRGPALYAGGSFQTIAGVAASRIARWDGATWSALGPGVDADVLALAVFDDGDGAALYAAGDFTTAGGVAASRIARWDGTTWSALDTGLSDRVFALAVFNDGGGPELYAGGQFLTAAGIPASRIARWDGSSWAPLGGAVDGVNGTVHALVAFNDGSGPALYAGGLFTSAAGSLTSRVARWNGASWSRVGTGFNAAVYALAVFDAGGGPALYAGGGFTSAGVETNRVARWNGIAWTMLGAGTGGDVLALSAFDDGSGAKLYAGGSFTTAGGGAASRIACWDGASWTEPGGADAPVSTLLPFDDGTGPSLYAGGDLVVAGGTVVNHIGRWDGAAWAPTAAGQGLDDSVFALKAFDDGDGPALYAGGQFVVAGGTSASRVARWSGTSWEALGSGTSGDVFALEVYDEGTGAALFAGGLFASAGGVAASNIARWSAGSWSALGSGLDGAVQDLKVWDDGGGPALFAGGLFTSAGGVAAANVARWRGGAWSALGAGTTSVVRALAVYDDGGGPALYAGGDFAQAGGVAASRIARWNGVSWAPLGSGVNNRVFSLGVADAGGGLGPALFAGGQFTTAGGMTATRIARWNGAAWAPLGFGANALVLALQGFDDGLGPALYAAGQFTGVDGAAANYIARWDASAGWSALASDMNATIHSLELFDDDGGGPRLHAGGDFTTAGDAVSNFIARRIGPSFPEILAGPDSRSLCVGERLELTVDVSGTVPFEFQWLKDGEEVEGATSASLVLDPASVLDTGNYQVLVADLCGASESALAGINVLRPPEVLGQPQGQAACAGGAVIISIAANGSPPLEIEWWKNGERIDGATNELLVLDPVSLADEGSYEAVISNPCGAETSAAATLTVDSPPSIEAEPASQQAVCAGEGILLSVTASGTPPLSYQWRKDDADLEGANADVLIVDPVGEKDVGRYEVVVSNRCGEAVSRGVTLSLLDEPAITAHPLDRSACPGSSVVLAVAATGTPPLAFQWRKDGKDIEGAVESVYAIDPVGPDDAAAYDVVVSNPCATLESLPARLVLDEAPEVTLEPAGAELCPGAAVLFEVAAVGTEPLAFQWRKDGKDIEGAVGPSYAIDPVDLDDAGSYDAVVSNPCTEVTGAAVVSAAAVLAIAQCFHRGDPNSTGGIDLSDAIGIFNFLFLGGDPPLCREAADVDNEDGLNISDGIALLNFLFLGGDPPAPPGPTDEPCGLDPDPPGSPANLGCASYTGC